MAQFHNSTKVSPARPRSRKLREAGYYGSAPAGGTLYAAPMPSEITGYFEPVENEAATVIGVRALYDLYITQMYATDGELVVKNVSEILRLQERVNIGTEDSPKHALKITGGVISDGDVVAYGTAAEGTSPAAYDRLDPATFGTAPADHTWPTYDSSKAGYVLSAALGWNLAARVSALESNPPAATLAGLTDVAVTGATADQVLMYDGQLHKWVPGTVSGGSGDTGSFLPLSAGSGYPLTGTLYWNKTISEEEYSGAVAIDADGYLAVTVTSLGAMRVSGGVIAAGDVVAYGTAAEGTSPAAYDRLDPATFGTAPADHTWPAYDSSKAGYVLSAALGWNLAARVSALESNPPAATLAGLTDVAVTGATADQVLMYDGQLHKWVPGTVSGGSGDTGSFLPLSAGSGYPLTGTLYWNRTISEEEYSGAVAIDADGYLAVTVTSLGAMRVSGGVIAAGDVVAYGTAAEGTSPAAYDRLDPATFGTAPADHTWPTYDSSKAGYVLSAALGWNLAARLTALENSGGGTGSGSTVMFGTPANGVVRLTVDGSFQDLSLSDHTHSQYLTEHQSLSGYATQTWVNQQGFLKTHQSLSGYATQTWVNNQGFIKTSALSSYATQNWVNQQGFLKTHQDLSGYALVSHGHSGMLTTTNLSSYIYWISRTEGVRLSLNGDSRDLALADHTHSQYLTSHQSLSGYATQTWVNQQGFLKTHQSLSGYATQSWVQQQGYLTSHQSLSGYLPLTAGSANPLTGALYLGDSSHPGSVVLKRGSYSATISINSSGHIEITPTSTGRIYCAGTVYASGDIVAYS